MGVRSWSFIGGFVTAGTANGGFSSIPNQVAQSSTAVTNGAALLHGGAEQHEVHGQV